MWIHRPVLLITQTRTITVRNCNIVNACSFLDVSVLGNEKGSVTEEKEQQKMLKRVFISKA